MAAYLPAVSHRRPSTSRHQNSLHAPEAIARSGRHRVHADDSAEVTSGGEDVAASARAAADGAAVVRVEATTDPRYAALASRDRRFDGEFFVGVTSTGIYCRPVCPARTPRPHHCRFYGTAAAAERDGFRPCLRCRPELAPGRAPMDDATHFAHAALHLIERGVMDNGGGVAALALHLGFSIRQTNRLVQAHFGVAPVELAQTRRLLLAKRLLTESRMPVHEVAMAAGFGSVRRLNHLFVTRYGLSPASFRRSESTTTTDGVGTRLLLTYRPPIAWQYMLQFLAARAMAGVEEVVGDVWRRSVCIGDCTGWIEAQRISEDRCEIGVTISDTLLPAVSEILPRVRRLFDLDARPDRIQAHLAAVEPEVLGPALTRRPGLRAVGAFDGFEVAMRAILGQQVSVAAATTMSHRIAARFGEPFAGDPQGRLRFCTPSATAIADADEQDLMKTGLIRSRAETLRRLADAVASGRMALEPGASPATVVPQLLAMRGIGPWTAGYIAMRCLRSPDHYPMGDLILRRAAGGLSARALEIRSQAWTPWRAYAAMHLWAMSADDRA